MAYAMAPQQAVVMTTTTANNTGMPNAKQGAWSTDLLDCFAAPGGAGQAFYACACSPCAYGDMAAIAPPDSIMFAGNCYLAGCCFMMMPHLFLCASQQGLRTAFNIQGSCFGDACSACCCPVCALLQQNRECLIRNAQPQTQMNPVIMMQQPQQMVMQPQMMMVQQPQVMYVQR